MGYRSLAERFRFTTFTTDEVIQGQSCYLRNWQKSLVWESVPLGFQCCFLIKRKIVSHGRKAKQKVIKW